MEIDVFSFLFSLKTKRKFKEKRLEEDRERDEKRDEKRSPEYAIRAFPTRRARARARFSAAAAGLELLRVSNPGRLSDITPFLVG